MLRRLRRLVRAFRFRQRKNTSRDQRFLGRHLRASLAASTSLVLTAVAIHGLKKNENFMNLQHDPTYCDLDRDSFQTDFTSLTLGKNHRHLPSLSLAAAAKGLYSGSPFKRSPAKVLALLVHTLVFAAAAALAHFTLIATTRLARGTPCPHTLLLQQTTAASASRRRRLRAKASAIKSKSFARLSDLASKGSKLVARLCALAQILLLSFLLIFLIRKGCQTPRLPPLPKAPPSFADAGADAGASKTSLVTTLERHNPLVVYGTSKDAAFAAAIHQVHKRTRQRESP